MHGSEAILIPIIALLIPIILVPVVLGIRYERQKRELEHAERMRALELGRMLPGDETWFTPAKISLAIGAGVPVAVFMLALTAAKAVGFREEIFVFAGLVGMTGVICGTILAHKAFELRSPSDPGLTAGHASYAKPMVDDDAYDVTASRG
jgi:hypothetical protein